MNVQKFGVSDPEFNARRLCSSAHVVLNVNSSDPEISKFRRSKNASISKLIIMFDFHSLFKILEIISSAYVVYQTMKAQNFSKVYVIVKNVDEVKAP